MLWLIVCDVSHTLTRQQFPDIRAVLLQYHQQQNGMFGGARYARGYRGAYKKRGVNRGYRRGRGQQWGMEEEEEEEEDLSGELSNGEKSGSDSQDEEYLKVFFLSLLFFFPCFVGGERESRESRERHTREKRFVWNVCQ